MYVSSFLPLQSALSGVEAAQEELATTANNIGNANAPGYAEERVNLAPNPALTEAGGGLGGYQLGTGVSATSITNASNQYLDTAFRNQNATTAGANTLQGLTGQLQGLLGENNNNRGAISAQLQNFWKDWNNLADNPGNTGAQQSIVDDGQGLTASINELSAGMQRLGTQASDQYANLTQNGPGGQIYDDVHELASLNGQIKDATQGGYAANSLLDQRNKVLDDLSSLATVQVSAQRDGTVNVNFGGIANLVAGTSINWPAGGGTTLGSSSFGFPGPASSVGGTCGALLGFAGPGGTLASTLTQLDGVANQLSMSMANKLSSSTNGVTTFFATGPGGAPGQAAAGLVVNPALVANPSKVPVTATGTAGANEIALAVAGLQGGPPDQAYQGLVETVGGIAQQANAGATNAAAMQTQVFNQRQSAEGVDMNQEMSNLVQEQQAYQASAKVMGAFSTMMNSLLSVVGQ